MDEMTTLEQMRADVPAPTPETLAAIRAQLTGATEATPLVRPRRRMPLRWRLAAGVAAAVTAAAGVAVLTVGGDHGSGRPPTGGQHAPRVTTAADALTLAADNTRRTGDPTLAPGQYTHVVSDQWNGQQADGIVFQGHVRSEVWVPASAGGTWWWRMTGQEPTFANSQDEATVRANHPEYFRHATMEWSGHNGKSDRVPAGQKMIQYGYPGPDWSFPTPAWLAQQPTDPAALLAAVEKAQPTPQPGTPAKGDLATLTFLQIGMTLSCGFVPADLRSALYQVAKQIPGVTLVSDDADVAGRKGVSVGRLEPYGFLRGEILFDPATGQYLGEREVVVRPVTEDGNLPAGTVYQSTSVTTDVTANPNLF